MRRHLSILFTIWALGGVANAQPHDLFKCLHLPDPSNPACMDVGGGLVLTDCNSRQFEQYYGRIAWFPLQCVGPITVEIESYAAWNTRFPLYVEVVPYDDPTEVCEGATGYVIMVVHGSQDQCGTWDVSPLTDITSVVPLGSQYALRVNFFGQRAGFSPAMDCVRVTAQVQRSGVAPIGWGRFRSLYK